MEICSTFNYINECFVTCGVSLSDNTLSQFIVLGAVQNILMSLRWTCRW